MAHLRLFRNCLQGTAGVLAVLLSIPPVVTADTITNGTTSGIPTAGFLFEPEVPLASLKTVPTWNELEQLLDNPYAITLCATYLLSQASVALTPGNDQNFPSVCTNTSFVRRPSFGGVTLPPLLVNPLNYNPTSGERMRLLNPNFPGGAWNYQELRVRNVDGVQVAPGAAGFPQSGGVVDFVDPLIVPACPSSTQLATMLATRTKTISSGGSRIAPGEHEIDYNSPITAEPFTCVPNVELPEIGFLLGRDPGEPAGYSAPAVNLGSNISGVVGNLMGALGPLIEPTTGAPILPRNASTGAGGLKKPSLRVPPYGTPAAPGYLVNTAPDNVAPSNENDYVRNRNEAITLGKAFFWDMQVGSDGVQSCGTCHFNGTGTDTRTRNQLNPNHLSGDLTLQLHPANSELTAADFPLHKLRNPDVAGDPKCTTPIVATITAGVLENNFPLGGSMPVCDANNIVSSVNDVVSSMGVVFSPFSDIASIGAFQPADHGVQAVMPDLRTPGAQDPIPAFQGFRRVEPRNTPTMQAAGFNFDNFWDGRARHDFNGGSVFGAADPQSHVFVNNAGNLTATRQIIRFASIASLATGPGLSEFEMSFQGRNWAKIGKKLLQAGVTPLANQLVSTTDSALGRYSNQGGSACGSLLPGERSPGAPAPGKPGLCITYKALIARAYYPALWQNTTQHLNGCYTDGNATLHPNQCAAVGTSVSIPVLSNGAVANSPADPFDGYVLSIAAGPASTTDTNQFAQMEGNFSLFWGLSVHLWVGILVPDNTPFDQFLDQNPDAFKALGEPGELGLVDDLLNCANPLQRNCFRPVGNFKRDPNVTALIGSTGEGGAGGQRVPAGGTRQPNDKDPLLGLDIFFSSNLSLKNPNFRTARCGECHAVPTLTDHTMPFTFKAQLRDFVSEFPPGQPGVESIVEPLGRLRVISGFLLESEMNENGQDGVERRIADQSIVPNPSDGLAYPGGLLNPTGDAANGVIGSTATDIRYTGAAAGYFDNGVYNLGVTPCEANQTMVVAGGRCDDVGRGGDDAFGWPLSLATLLLKNLGGPAQQPGTEVPGFNSGSGATGGLFEDSDQDPEINPGSVGDPVNPLLPPYLAPWANQINVGDSAPELDEVFSGINTLTNVAMLEGFLDTLGPFDAAGTLNENLNVGDGPLMGSWPVVNRVGRFGSFKAPQLRNVELTGPYFHNGGKLTLRQVVDFYVRGGDFPVTNATHRDFNMVNMDVEVQSNLKEEEKVALVDFLLELTDERNRFDRAPFDHPQVIVPVDGTAPDNTTGRGALLASPLFKNVPEVGAAGLATPEPSFLNVTSGPRLVGGAANCAVPTNHYCH